MPPAERTKVPAMSPKLTDPRGGEGGHGNHCGRTLKNLKQKLRTSIVTQVEPKNHNRLKGIEVIASCKNSQNFSLGPRQTYLRVHAYGSRGSRGRT